jgi:hypothetical protein
MYFCRVVHNVCHKQTKILFIIDLRIWLVGQTALSITSLATIQILSSVCRRVYRQMLTMSGMLKLPAVLAKNVSTNSLVSIYFIVVRTDYVAYQSITCGCCVGCQMRRTGRSLFRYVVGDGYITRTQKKFRQVTR